MVDGDAQAFVAARSSMIILSALGSILRTLGSIPRRVPKSGDKQAGVLEDICSNPKLDPDDINASDVQGWGAARLGRCPMARCLD